MFTFATVIITALNGHISSVNLRQACMPNISAGYSCHKNYMQVTMNFTFIHLANHEYISVEHNSPSKNILSSNKLKCSTRENKTDILIALWMGYILSVMLALKIKYKIFFYNYNFPLNTPLRMV